MAKVGFLFTLSNYLLSFLSTLKIIHHLLLSPVVFEKIKADVDSVHSVQKSAIAKTKKRVGSTSDKTSGLPSADGSEKGRKTQQKSAKKSPHSSISASEAEIEDEDEITATKSDNSESSADSQVE